MCACPRTPLQPGRRAARHRGLLFTRVLAVVSCCSFASIDCVRGSYVEQKRTPPPTHSQQELFPRGASGSRGPLGQLCLCVRISHTSSLLDLVHVVRMKIIALNCTAPVQPTLILAQCMPAMASQRTMSLLIADVAKSNLICWSCSTTTQRLRFLKEDEMR